VLRRVIAGTAAVVVLAACGSSTSRTSTTTSTTSTTSTTTTVTTTTSAPGTTTTTAAAPTTAAPTTAAPTTAAPATAAPTTQATATTAAAPPPVLHITAADGGQTLSEPVGGTVSVDLSTGELWSEPASDSPVLVRTSGEVNSSTGDATATFSAASPGAAKISSTHRCLPQPGKACAMYIALWSVTINVT